MWYVNLDEQATIKTILIIDRDEVSIDPPLKNSIVTVGNDEDFTKNPICLKRGDI